MTTPKDDGYAHVVIDHDQTFDLWRVCFLNDFGDADIRQGSVNAQKNLTMRRAWVSMQPKTGTS